MMVKLFYLDEDGVSKKSIPSVDKLSNVYEQLELDSRNTYIYIYIYIFNKQAKIKIL